MTAAMAPRCADVVQIVVHDEFDVADVIAATLRFCAGHGVGPVFAAHVATAASELANNLWMHARGGRVQLAWRRTDGRDGVELIADDDGPGIADVALALTEGYSTGGGMGCGLPGVKRLMDEFSIAARPTGGTRVQACKWLRPRG
jgi:serine/threonine-protein kinase RsbT